MASEEENVVNEDEEEVLSFADWYKKKTGVTLSNPDSAYLNDPYARGGYEAYLRQIGTDNYHQAVDKYNNGEMSATDLQGYLANTGIPMSSDQNAWLNNQIAQQVTQESRDYNTQMRDTSLTSAASQLDSLGLNMGSVISTGGAGIGNSPVADTSKQNTAQEKEMASFQKSAQMTRTLVGLIGGMASAGVYGGTRVLAQKALSACASAVANSGLSVINHTKYDDMDWDQLQQALR